MAKVYRAVPSDVKEGSLRDGDWVTPSKEYAKDHARANGWGRKYRIIEEEVEAGNLFWDGNDISEWDIAPIRILATRIPRTTGSSWTPSPMMTMAQ